MRERKRSLSQRDLKLLGVQPRLQAIRYDPDQDRATVRQLTAEARPRTPSPSGVALRRSARRASASRRARS
jgi:hypothetical protein